MYFYRYLGEDFPIFFSKGETPNEAQLREGITHIQTIKQDGEKRYKESRYNKMDKTSARSFLDGDFIKFAADKFTRGDFTKYFNDEAGKANRWFVKLDTAWIHQYGVTDKEAEDALPADLKGQVTVREVKKDESLSNFWNYIGKLVGKDKTYSWSRYAFWKTGDVIVDLVDLAVGDYVLELAEALKVPKDGLRDVSYEFLKIGSDATRGFFNPRSPYLQYERAV